MSSAGRTSKVHIIGTSGNIADVSGGNALKTDSSNRKFIPLGKIRIGNINYVQLPNAVCSEVQIRNLDGNGNVYIGGSGSYVAQAGIMQVIYGGEFAKIQVNNANELSLIADNINTDVLVSVLSNIDVNTTVSNPPPPDFIPPTVSGTFPSGAAVQANSSLYFLFSEEIDASTVTNTNITVSPAFAYTVSKDSVNPFKVLILPSSNLALSTTFTITASTGIKDLAGNNMVAPSSFSFTTAATPPGSDLVPPTVVLTNPVNNAIDTIVSISPTISFSKAMLSSTINTTNIKAFKDSDNSTITIASVSLSVDMKTVTLILSGLANSTKYRIEVGTGVSDTSGNFLVAKYITFFSTIVPSSTIVFQTSGNVETPMYVGAYSQILEVVATNKSVLYNQILSKYIVELRVLGSPPGHISIVILNDTNAIVHTFTGTIDASTLTTTYQPYTFTTTNNSLTMKVGWKVGVNYPVGDGAHIVYAKFAAGTAYNKPDSYLRLYLNGSYIDYTDSDVGAIIYN